MLPTNREYVRLSGRGLVKRRATFVKDFHAKQNATFRAIGAMVNITAPSAPAPAPVSFGVCFAGREGKIQRQLVEAVVYAENHETEGPAHRPARGTRAVNNFVGKLWLRQVKLYAHLLTVKWTASTKSTWYIDGEIKTI